MTFILTHLGSLLVRELWVGNLQENVTEEELQRHFSAFGVIENIELFKKVYNTTNQPIPSISRCAVHAYSFLATEHIRFPAFPEGISSDKGI